MGIEKVLFPLFNNDFILLDLPYHTNIGDVLIWEGEVQFLRQIANHRLLYYGNALTWRYKKIPHDTIVLLHGGGNFGDVWPETHSFKEKIIAAYPDNRIIIFPQTAWYNDKYHLIHDVEAFSRHKNLTLCARDKNSYDLLKKYFTANTVLLVPDMAFCIKPEELQKYCLLQTKKTLLLKRSDQELDSSIDYRRCIPDSDVDIADWPTLEKPVSSAVMLGHLLGLTQRCKLFTGLANIYASNMFRQDMVKRGVQFVSQYEQVYTTRLHVAILCCLLGKPFHLFDNNYGKNSRFFDTWLMDLDGGEMIHSE
jgi:pyruvyl transferase EpsO